MQVLASAPTADRARRSWACGPTSASTAASRSRAAAPRASLRAAEGVAGRHGVPIANVATRWVLEQPHVAGVIVGARLGESEHRDDNARLFDFELDEADRAALGAAFEGLAPIPGDCGDEYRRPPFLTASGDLPHHLAAIPAAHRAEPVPGRPGWTRVSTGSVGEDLAGYARAVRVGERVLVSGTTATHGSGRVVAPDDAGAQATYAMDKVLAALRAFGAEPADVVRTRVYVSDVAR